MSVSERTRGEMTERGKGRRRDEDGGREERVGFRACRDSDDAVRCLNAAASSALRRGACEFSEAALMG